MEDIFKPSTALDLAEEYYEYDSTEWHAFNKGFNNAQRYYKFNQSRERHSPACEFGTNKCMICGKTVDEHFHSGPKE